MPLCSSPESPSTSAFRLGGEHTGCLNFMKCHHEGSNVPSRGFMRSQNLTLMKVGGDARIAGADAGHRGSVEGRGVLDCPRLPTVSNRRTIKTRSP
jgi:hypothetical protein